MINIRGNKKTITINNNRVFVNGVEKNTGNSKTINITIEGNVEKLEVDSCNEITTWNVSNLSTKSGDVNVTGNVLNNLKTISGDVEVGGYIGNDVSTTSGDISCGEVKGSAKTLSGDINKK